MKKTLLLLLIIFSINKIFSQDYKKTIDTYLSKEITKLKVNIEDIKEYAITDQYDSKKQGLTHIYINQLYNGISIFNSQVNFTIKNDKIIYATSNLEKNISSRIGETNPVITPITAIKKSTANLGINYTEDVKLIKKDKNNNYFFEKGNISEDPIRVRLFLKPVGDNDIKLVWEVLINNFSKGEWWNVYVDAINGEIVDKRNIVISCFSKKHLHEENPVKKVVEKPFSFEETIQTTLNGGNYNVYEFPAKHPEDSNRTLINNPSDDTASPYGWHDTNGVTGHEYTTTRGNNVLAHVDGNGDNTIGFQPDGGSTLSFDYPLNLNTAPTGYRNASVTNLFYVNNIMHDVWYHYGFDEAAGNFQSNNYSNGGVAGDYVIADAQDGSGTDNANFATPDDGSSPRMQMYLWKYPFIPKRVVVNSPSSLAGEYTATKSDFGYQMLSLPFDWKTGDLILADDGTTGIAQDGDGSSSLEGCNAYNSSIDYNGKIALIKRGNCNFDVKVQNAQDAGAIGAIIYQRAQLPTEANDEYYTYVNMTGTTGSINIPSLFISKNDALTFVNELTSGGTINVTMKEPETEKDRDGSLDNQIIAHEYTHGISTRLTGGPSNSGCLSSLEQMGEGWSDWAAYMMTLTSNSSATENLNLGEYVLWGAQLREAPYTTDMAENNYKYAYTNQVNGEVHSIGFVWSSILWDLTWKYIDQYGFDSNLYTGTGGNNKLMETVLLAMKMQPCDPNFITGRDAILAADEALSNGANACMIWEAFARRGVGFNASAGGNEDFSLPSPMPASCVTSSVKDINIKYTNIYPNPSNGLFTISTESIINNSTITITDVLGKIIYQEKKSINNKIEIDLSRYNHGIYYINIKNESINESHKIIIE